MKILLCSPYKGAVGGIQRWTNHIINYYNGHVNYDEFQIDFYCLSRKTSIVSDINIFKRIIYGIFEYPVLINGFRKEFQKKNYDIVHITSSASISLLKDIIILKITQRKKVKSVIHFRFGRIPELFQKKGWEYKLLIKVIKLADMVIVLDQKSYNALISEGYKNVQLLPNPLTPEISQIIEDNLEVRRAERTILFAGHVIESKGVFELLEACKSINNIKVKLIGQVTDAMLLKIKQSMDGNNSWLEIAGEQDYETTIKEMLSAGIFILPTYTEGFPNVILESMACGCPIIASGVGAIPEMLKVDNAEDYGICVEPKNIEQLTNAIKKMLENPEYAKECGENARKRVNATYSMPTVWNQMTEIWKSLIN